MHKMWLFSSSASANKDNATFSTDGDDQDSPMMKDEESTIETPQKSYSAMHTTNGCDNGVGEISNGTPLCREIGKCGTITIASPQSTSQSTTQQQHHNTTSNKQRGLIYFRALQPSDRTVIQTLHEQWFPVDYKSDFFDTLCSEQKIMPGGGVLGSQPLYSCVACFKELSDEEFEERLRRRKEREDRRRSEGNNLGWSFWSRRRSNKDEGEVDGYGSDEDDNDDCLLYELDDSRIDDHDRGTDVNVNKERSSYQDSTTSISDASVQSQHSSWDDTNDDTAMESGESAFSIHHRRERERMRQFYSNGFRFDRSDNATDRDLDRGKQTQQKIVAKDNKNICKNNTTQEEGPYYNDNGERIIGCIVGSFLPSSLPASKHRTTLDEKIGRDETAQLLVPDSTTYTKMFYIMTLGTSSEFRRCGLGSIMVNRVVNMIEQKEAECGALYLHVITYNSGAMRLYERLGFMRVKEIKDYYTINSVNYDCFLYARYFHGNRGHQTTFDVLYGIATSIIRKLGYALIPT